MQIVYQNKNEKCGSRGGTMDIIICAGRVGGYLKRKYDGEFRK